MKAWPRVPQRTGLAAALAAWLLLVLTGVFAAAGRVFVEIGVTPAAVRRYYLGAPEAMVYAKEFPELMEGVHVHLFAIPLVYTMLWLVRALVIGPRDGDRLLAAVTYANIAGFVAAPLAIRYVSGALAPLLPLHALFLAVSAVLITWRPLRALLSGGG